MKMKKLLANTLYKGSMKIRYTSFLCVE